jgi:CRP-like cAMP-binding protein
MSLEDQIKTLARAPIFSSLEPDALRLIAFAAETRELAAGDLLFRQGDLSDGGYVVASGSLTLTSSDNTTAAGKIIGPGALLGELSLLISTRNSATAIAHENSTVLKISRRLFLRTLDASPISALQLRKARTRELTTLSAALERARQTFLK